MGDNCENNIDLWTADTLIYMPMHTYVHTHTDRQLKLQLLQLPCLLRRMKNQMDFPLPPLRIAPVPR